MVKQKPQGVALQPISWNEVCACAEFLVRKIRSQIAVPDKVHILGVANGGIIPATLVAKRLLQFHPQVDVIHLEGSNQQLLLNRNEVIIIVDDIIDTGDTIHKIMGALDTENIYITAFYRRLNRPPINCYQHLMWAIGLKTDSWLWFPWESNAEYYVIQDEESQMHGKGSEMERHGAT